MRKFKLQRKDNIWRVTFFTKRKIIIIKDFYFLEDLEKYLDYVHIFNKKKGLYK